MLGKKTFEILRDLKSGTNDETNGRHIVPQLALNACVGKNEVKILDVGAGYGADLSGVSAALNNVDVTAQLFAIETFPAAFAHLVNLGVTVRAINIERERIPFEDEYFDLVICNQVLEHTKEIFWIVSELSRVLKVGSKLIVGVPNLGSLHNRLALLAGYQPPAIKVFGSHVRGFTTTGLREFLELGDVLKVRAIRGGNFYPLPAQASRPLSRLLPHLSVSSFYDIERTSRKPFLSIFDTDMAAALVDTPYHHAL